MIKTSIPLALAYPLHIGCELIALGRTRAWSESASGALRTYLCGRNRMVSHQALLDYVAAREAAAKSEMKNDHT